MTTGAAPDRPVVPRTGGDDAGAGCVVALDIGGTKTVAAVVPAEGPARTILSRTTPARDPAAIEALVHEAVASAPDPVVGVGLSVAGLVGSDRSTVHMAPNIAWRDRDVGSRVRALVGVPVVVENDVNAAAWGEYLFGAGAGSRLMVMVTLGTGVGGAAVIGGRLLRGHAGVAAEFGHLPHEKDGRPCGCGLRGCWEQYCSGRALIREVRDRIAAGENSLLGSDPDAVTGAAVHAAADRGDALSRDAFATIGRHLGNGIATLATMFDPDLVVIGGGLAAASEHLEPAVRTGLAGAMPPLGPSSGPQLAFTTTTAGSAMRGVAELVRDRVGAQSRGTETDQRANAGRTQPRSGPPERLPTTPPCSTSR